MKIFFQIKSLIFSIVILIVFSSCSSNKYIYKTSELNSIFKERIPEKINSKIIIPFKANAEIQAFAQRITIGAKGTKKTCRRLIDGIINKSNLNIRYNKVKTKSAIDLFYKGEGNCLAYTNLFIAMARSIGIRAFFVDASLLVNSLEEKGGTIINSGHIIAGVYSESNLLFIDFSKKIHHNLVGFCFMSDIEAIAHYYNNLGYEKWKSESNNMNKNEYFSAIKNFQVAVAIYPSFYRGYNNLGVIYNRLGEIDRAIHYYEKAISINSRFAAPYSNLGMIYFQKNQFKSSRKYFLKGAHYSRNNYIIPYFLGRIAIKQNQFEKAKTFLLKSIRIKRNFKLAHSTLAQLYKRLGELKKAEKEQKIVEMLSN